ncbi:hypothetical protein SS05631_b51520 (plasmid) [Sinorhizobium sp. CCBAU 05631]|nr:hypothetical protein SS05631_b51520 [Sinorhizobium sp. CCBAU 05631]
MAGSVLPSSKDAASAYLSAASPSSRTFKSLEHLFKLSVLQMKPSGELDSQRFDFFVEYCHVTEEQIP